MKIDVLVAEIGSTTTVVNGFDRIKTKNPVFVGQGISPTTVSLGDVNIGLLSAIDNLKINLKTERLIWDEFFASSSAAGGLSMTVHGLVYDMTVRAAREAALGAGAIIKYVTSGKLKKSDLKNIVRINPKLILIAGGVDYGERDTALYNAFEIANLNLHIPVIYGGNVENREEIISIFEGKMQKVYIVDNVYPRIDDLNIEPARKVIQKAFEEHITSGPGMENVRNIVDGPIIPTPGAAMEAAMALYEEIGDLIVLDVGGATTDVHSVTSGSDEIQRILLSPEPLAKRTVEGDLGVYVNLLNIVDMIGNDRLVDELGEGVEEFIKNPKPIPQTELENKLIERLTLEAVSSAVARHAGRMRNLYGPSGKKTVAEGKDLTKVKWVIGTGGALTRLSNGKEIMKNMILSCKDNELGPGKDAQTLIDKDYIMASLGVLSTKYRDAALCLMKKSLGLA